MSDDVEVFRTSLNRCLAVPGFLVTFYELFMSSSEEVREKFRSTDFERQHRVLADSLYLMAVAAQGEPESPVWAELAGLAKRHDRTELDIRPGLYDAWLDCLIQAVRRHDPQFAPEIEEAWRRTLRSGIDFLRSRH